MADKDIKPQVNRIIISVFHPSGIPIQLEYTGLDGEQLTEIINRLQHAGYWSKESIAAAIRDEAGNMVCTKHRMPMSLRNMQGDQWYSHAIVDPRTGKKLYCRGRAGTDSPGWDIPG